MLAADPRPEEFFSNLTAILSPSLGRYRFGVFYLKPPFLQTLIVKRESSPGQSHLDSDRDFRPENKD